MTTKEIVDSILELLKIATACNWPFVLLFVIFVFRKQIRAFIPSLSERLKKAEFVGTKWEFSEVSVKALQDAVETGAEEFKNDPEKLVSFVREQVNKIPSVQSIQAPSEEPDLSNKSVLWVDDKPTNNVYEASILKRLGANILFARSTSEALSFLNVDGYDLIISDVHRVEDGNSNRNAGYDLLASMRKTDRKTPLIYYTGNASKIDKHRSATAFGVADYPSRLVELAIKALQES